MATKRTASEILAEQHWKRRMVNVEAANNQKESENLASKENADNNNNSNSSINNPPEIPLMDSVRMPPENLEKGDGDANVQTYVLKYPEDGNEALEAKYVEAVNIQEGESTQTTVTSNEEVEKNDVNSQNREGDTNTEGYVEVSTANENEHYICIVNNKEGETMIMPSEGYIVVEAQTVPTHRYEESSYRDEEEKKQCLSPAEHCHQVAGIQVETHVDRPRLEVQGTEQVFHQKVQYQKENQSELYQTDRPNNIPIQTPDTVVQFQVLPNSHVEAAGKSQNVPDDGGENTESKATYQHTNSDGHQFQAGNNQTSSANMQSTTVGYPAQRPCTDSTTVHNAFAPDKSLSNPIYLGGYPAATMTKSVESPNNIGYSGATNSVQTMNQRSQYVQPNSDQQTQPNFCPGQHNTFETYSKSGYQSALGNSYQNTCLNAPNADQIQAGRQSREEMSYLINTPTYPTVQQSGNSAHLIGNLDQHTNVPKQTNGSNTAFYGSQESTVAPFQCTQEVHAPMQNYQIQSSVQPSAQVLPQIQPLIPPMQQTRSVVPGASVQYMQQQNVQAPVLPPDIPTAQQVPGSTVSQERTVHQTYRKNDSVYPNLPTVPNNDQYPEVIEHLFNTACYMQGGQQDQTYPKPLPELHHSDVASIENSKDSYYPMTPTRPPPNFYTRPPYSPIGMQPQPQYWPPPPHGNPICSAKPYNQRNYRHSPYPYPPCHCNASHSPAPHCRGYHSGQSRVNHVSRHQRRYSSPYTEYGYGDPKANSRRNSSCCHTPYGDSDCSLYSPDNGPSPSPASGRSSSAIRGRPSGDFSVEGAEFHSRMMRRSARDSFSPSSESDDNSFSSAQPGLGGKLEKSGKPLKNSLSDPNNPVLSSLPAPGLQRTKFLVSTYIDYLVEENERITDMSKAFTPPTYLFLEEEEYVLNAHKEKDPFPSNRFSNFIKEYFPQVDTISVAENKAQDNSSNISRLNLYEKTFDEFAHTVFFGCQDMIEKSKKTPVNTLPSTVPPVPAVVAGN